MRRLTLAAALSASFILAPALAMASGQGGTEDIHPAGVDDIGIDISSVVLTPSAVHSFLSTLPAEQRHDVQAACAFRDKIPTGANEQTLLFCADAARS